MRERYLCMIQLQDQLMQLFELCGVQPERVQVKQMPVPLLWLEKLIQDNQLYNYLEDLSALAARAVVEMKERKLDDWCNQENERLVEELADQLEQKDFQLEEKNDRILRLEKELRAETEKTKLAEDRSVQEQVKLIRSIITQRDNLLMKKSWLQDCMPEEEMAAKFVNGQLQETAKILKEMGVSILEENGPFDSRCHTVVETRPAPAPELVDRIAETFRPGYAFRGETLRPQEVILYGKA